MPFSFHFYVLSVPFWHQIVPSSIQGLSPHPTKEIFQPSTGLAHHYVPVSITWLFFSVTVGGLNARISILLFADCMLQTKMYQSASRFSPPCSSSHYSLQKAHRSAYMIYPFPTDYIITRSTSTWTILAKLQRHLRMDRVGVESDPSPRPFLPRLLLDQPWSISKLHSVIPADIHKDPMCSSRFSVASFFVLICDSTAQDVEIWSSSLHIDDSVNIMMSRSCQSVTVGKFRSLTFYPFGHLWHFPRNAFTWGSLLYPIGTPSLASSHRRLLITSSFFLLHQYPCPSEFICAGRSTQERARSV